MRRLTTGFAALIALALCAPLSLGADAPAAGAAAPQTQTVTGILIDQMCGGDMMKKADPEAAAAEHKRTCALKDSCADSGYAVISGKKILRFDDKGDTLAKDFLTKSELKNDVRVTVTGTEKGDTFEVASITAAPQKSDSKDK